MEPLPESQVAADLLGTRSGTDVLADLRAKADSARHLVPELLGASVTWTASELTLTVVASPGDFAVLDALQYLAGGPAVDAVSGGETVDRADLVLDEDRWSLFARGAAAAGIASSLSFPLRSDERMIGGVNLYAGSRRAFAGVHEELARLFGGWVSEVVSDADLAFRSREDAVVSSRRLAEQVIIDQATTVIALELDLGRAQAREQLEDAARRAGVSLAALSVTVIEHWG